MYIKFVENNEKILIVTDEYDNIREAVRCKLTSRNKSIMLLSGIRTLDSGDIIIRFRGTHSYILVTEATESEFVEYVLLD